MNFSFSACNAAEVPTTASTCFASVSFSRLWSSFRLSVSAWRRKIGFYGDNDNDDTMLLMVVTTIIIMIMMATHDYGDGDSNDAGDCTSSASFSSRNFDSFATKSLSSSSRPDSNSNICAFNAIRSPIALDSSSSLATFYR